MVERNPGSGPIAATAAETPTATDGLAVTAAAPRPSRTRWMVGGLVAIVAIVGAVMAAMILGARPLPEALRYIPADSVVVIELRPDLPGDQRQHLGNLLAHFPGFADQSILDAKLDESFDRIVSVASDGSVDYSTRIKPLLAGPLVAALGMDGISQMTGDAHDVRGLLVATTDGSATCDVVFGASTPLETHRAVKIRSIHNDLTCAEDGRFLLIGDAASIRSGIDAQVDHTSIGTNATFKTARERLDGDQVGLVYLDGKALLGLLQGIGSSDGLDAAVSAHVPEWMVVGLRVVDDTLQIEMHSAAIPETKFTDAVPTDPPPAKSHFARLLPPDTLAFAEAHGMGANLQRAVAILRMDPQLSDTVDQAEQALAAVGGFENVVSWIEDVGVAAIPTGDTVGGVILIRGTDADAAASRFTQVHTLLLLASTGTDITVRDADHGGVTITTVDLGDLEPLLSGLGVDAGINGADTRVVFSMAIQGDVLLLAVGDGAIERILDVGSGSSLATSGTYRRVIDLVGSPNDVEGYVAIDGLLEWLVSYLPADIDVTTWKQELGPYLEHVAGFGGAHLSTDTGGNSRLVITVK